MAFSLKNINSVKIIGIIVLLLLAFVATTASASTQRSVATLSGDISASGSSIPVHDGSLSLTGSNFSNSKNSMNAIVKRHLVTVDPVITSKNLSVGTSGSWTVFVSASNYYARAESVRYAIYGAVSFSEYYQ